ncbi:DUF4352 domain-containing protein [Domibacillus sp. PGB-M46]|uniref:DUF4352 domain-containing protein n=1 Tax=Domibacillus sp. PGB-M46 TaxID=2910255 RepID=UPI001F56DD0C|nr:DUF4352 domain-containing protein [Domibacillus sp. PGB-M46]MCI2256270.1 DUF4352 domain-containing protein [Domibacillus sp. PGB-M46]
MKKLSYLGLVLMLLAGCSAGAETEDAASKEQAETKTADQTETADLATNEDVYVPSAQITDDINLVKVGETVTDAKGELTLEAYKKVNKTVQVGSVEMLIKDVKVVHFVPDYSMIDFFHGYTHDEEFDFVKVSVEVSNTSNETVQFTPVAFIQTSKGEHKTWEDDIYLEELTGDLEGNNIKKGNMGFILEDGNDITSVDILTSDAVHGNGDVIEKAKKITVDF